MNNYFIFQCPSPDALEMTAYQSQATSDSFTNSPFSNASTHSTYASDHNSYINSLSHLTNAVTPNLSDHQNLNMTGNNFLDLFDTGNSSLLQVDAGNCFKEPVEHFCDICGKGFAQRCLRNRHLKIHSSKEKCKCPLCPYETTFRFNLKSHMLRKHLHVCNASCNHAPVWLVNSSTILLFLVISMFAKLTWLGITLQLLYIIYSYEVLPKIGGRLVAIFTRKRYSFEENNFFS